MVDYRTPSVPSPSDAETLGLGTARDQEAEAHERDYRTPSVPSPIVAETDGSVVVEANEPEVEADTHGSDMFASAVSVADSEVAIPLPPPPPPVPDVPRQHAEAASMLPYQFHRRDGKIRRMRPQQFNNLQRGMTSYQFMLQLNRGTISDSDDEGEPHCTIFADRMGHEYLARSRKRCNVCKNLLDSTNPYCTARLCMLF
eukprot:109259-Amphidinium_carterae.1